MEKNQLKYAQQHLANERTFLAWVRTVIAIVGVGFLATSLHFTIGVHRDPRIDLISIVLGMFACALGLVITVLATIGYLQKKRQINEGTFRPTSAHVILIAVFMVILLSMIILYFVFIKV
ncbi:YidH family protein [Peribacillus frigoritolerans]|uniref:YidH family protein n=1 Tax=Peribacillus frigoritolerans TaxID=450367 RepID=UPI003DA762A8